VIVEGDGRARLGAPTTETTDQVLMFGADWCGDCRRTKSWLRRNDVPFVAIDTDADPDARGRAAEVAGGLTNIPVVLTPDGTVLVEPTSVELATTLADYRRPRGGGRSPCR
jgi:glutaredoxin